MTKICLMCNGPFELSERVFAQRLIDDTDFCGKCFKDILENDGREMDYLDTICLVVV